MANNVIGQVLGGSRQILDDVKTVGEVKAKMGATGYTAAINGNPAEDSAEVVEGNIVTLSKAVKGGTI
jgi:hypothetical protein